jgi:bifunctional DNase/RNase
MDTGGGAVVLVEVKVQSLGLDRASNTPVLILRETEGDRVLPIWIGPGEASAIAMQLANMKFSRPLTHDLLASVISGLGGHLIRVVITRVAESTYYAELVIERDDSHVSVDARPSDSIAVALRADARIFAEEELLERAAIEISPDETSLSFESSETVEEESQPLMNADELKEYLRRLNPEDFGRFSP